MNADLGNHVMLARCGPTIPARAPVGGKESWRRERSHCWRGLGQPRKKDPNHPRRPGCAGFRSLCPTASELTSTELFPFGWLPDAQGSSSARRKTLSYSCVHSIIVPESPVSNFDKNHLDLRFHSAVCRLFLVPPGALHLQPVVDWPPKTNHRSAAFSLLVSTFEVELWD
jgi:hypothetical protein